MGNNQKYKLSPIIRTNEKVIIQVCKAPNHNDHTQPLFRIHKVLKFEDLYYLNVAN